MKLNPIIFSDPLFFEQPSGWVKHIPMAFYLIDILRPSVFVELGTHYGVSYFAFCQAVKEKSAASECYAVDSWQGDEHTKHYSQDVYDYVFKTNMENFSKFSILLKMSFDDASVKFKNGSIDLLHIDGYHTYEAVKHDFETWLPKMSNKGVVIFHDTQKFDLNFGVWKFFSELKNKYPAAELKFGHGLGIVCTGADVSADFISFLSEINEDESLQMMFEIIGQKIALQRKIKTLNKELKAAKIENYSPTWTSQNQKGNYFFLHVSCFGLSKLSGKISKFFRKFYALLIILCLSHCILII